MNKRVKTKWVKALRSGNYRQGRGRLREDGRFCCLGVLCDVSKLGRWPSAVHEPSYVTRRGIPCDAFLPVEVSEWAGVNRIAQGYLVNLNDGGNAFNEIANYIEAEL